MHFSCKITNAVLTCLENQSEDISPLYDQTTIPLELMRDPSSWLSAPDMEAFLENVLRLPLNKTPENILVMAGHEGPELRSWGVLDSVLRMMPRPQEVLNQPERFLSYFISPEPPIENLVHQDCCVSFDLPLPAEQYPLVTSYLKAAFESLPVYVGQGLANCEWNDISIKITWPDAQKSIFVNDPGHQISPDLLQSVIADHQKLLRELEEKNREIQRQQEDLDQARRDLQNYLQNREPSLIPDAGLLESFNFDNATPEHVIQQNLARLHDYMARSQQLITILGSQSKMSTAVKEAMRRMDWDRVKTQYPRAIAECITELRKLQTHRFENTPQEEKPHV